MILNKKKGILFWITGLSGAGKTSISNKIYKRIKDKYGKTFYVKTCATIDGTEANEAYLENQFVIE